VNNINTVKTANATDYANYAGAGATRGALQPGTDFSAVLANAMREQQAGVGISAGNGIAGMSAGYSLIQNPGIEQAIINAASSGRIDDAQIAMFMLCMMMQSDQDGGFSALMQVMGSMLMQIQGDKEALRNNVMSSEYDPYVLDTIDKGVFNTGKLDVTGTNRAIMPVEQWKPATPAITSDQSLRSPELYRAVIDQFQVGTAERYRPFRNGNTYCNIYVWDVTRAMGAEIPLYTDR
jgi:hypothetical protein